MYQAKYIAIGLALLSLTIPSLSIQAQGPGELDPSASPGYGTISALPGTPSVPNPVPVNSGGTIDLRQALPNCIGTPIGFVTAEPDVQIVYSGNAAYLDIYFESGEDSTLAVRMPDGVWLCDDDSYGDLNPFVRIPAPQPGSYLVWVGRYDYGVSVFSGSLYVNMQGVLPTPTPTPTAIPATDTSSLPSTIGTPVPGPNPQLPSTNGTVSLVPGFAPDPQQAPLTAGGEVDLAASLAGRCVGEAAGFAGTAPNYQVSLAGSGLEVLRFTLQAAGDTTLVIQAPDGVFYCDDDSGGGLNPMVTFNAPRSGVYSVWGGAYNAGERFPATLFITAQPGQGGGPVATVAPQSTSIPSTPAPNIGGLDPNGAPNYGGAVLNAFFADPHALGVTSGGSVNLRATLGGVCQGEAAGYASHIPDYRVTLQMGGNTPPVLYVAFLARVPGDDTTLAVQAPDGRWYCNDDRVEGVNLNPLVQLTAPLDGVYNIWVGSFYAGDPVGGQLILSQSMP